MHGKSGIFVLNIASISLRVGEQMDEVTKSKPRCSTLLPYGPSGSPAVNDLSHTVVARVSFSKL